MEHLKFLKKSFKAAVQFEESGRTFFLLAAEESKNPFAREVFKSLAEEELKHIERIKDVYEKSVAANTLPESTPASTNLPWQAIFKDAAAKVKDIVKPGILDDDSITLSLNFENKGYRMYDELAKKTDNPIEKKFFEVLRDEEHGHYLLIQQMKQFMINPVDWYGEQEHHFFEG